MLEAVNGTKFEYKRLTESEQKARGILGRLIGPIADFKNPTRNGRKYSERLWENVFANPIMQEKIKNRVCFGELGHPADRTETDIEKVAICLAEQPKKGKDGKIYGVFDILSTPNGKLLKTLCDYGCNIGISSRGQGDVTPGIDGDEDVDPDTYECECWDAVLIPGVETARLKYVREGLDKTNRLQLALRESLSNASDEARKVMEETLSNLNIQLNESATKEFKLDECTPIKDAAEAKALTQKLGAKWAFGAEDSLGVDISAKYFEMFAKEMDLYIYEDGKDSLCFGVKKDGTVYGPYDINNKPVKGVNINVSLSETLQESAEEDKKESEEKNEEDTLSDSEMSELFGDLQPLDLNGTSDDEEEGSTSEKSEEESTDAPANTADEIEVAEVAENEPEKSEEEIFLDFLANNFDEEQIKKVAKILDIEIVGEEGEDAKDDDEEDDDEENTEEDKDDTTTESDEDSEDIKDEESDSNKDAENDEKAVEEGFAKLLSNLKEAVKVRSDLEAELKSLQEKLAVSEAKVNESDANCVKLKEAVIRLSAVTRSNKDLKDKATELDEALKSRDNTIKDLTEQLNRANENMKSQKQLNENLDSQRTKIDETAKALNEQLTINKNQQAEMQKLTEQVNKQTSLKESFKNLANKAVNKYIEVKADTLGLTPQEIKRKLGESYTMEEVDQVCEDLKKYYFNVSNLPFQADRKIGVRVNEGGPRKMMPQAPASSDDDVDDLLMRMARFGG